MSDNLISLSTNLEGRVGNTYLPVTKCLLPLFEAVVNSIQAIDDSVNKNNGKIHIEVVRDIQQAFDFENSEKIKDRIKGFRITDNGIGFTEENFTSFITLDSSYKKSKGCKGIGRLLWLKAFSSVSVESIFREKNVMKKRTFSFSAKNNVSKLKVSEIPNSSKMKTVILLENIYETYSRYLPQTISSIAQQLLNHFLWFFIRTGGSPEIIISDESDTINLNTLFDNFMICSAKPISFEIKSVKFELTHIKVNSAIHDKHEVYYCAAGRVVDSKNLKGYIPGLYGAIKDGEESFCCETFVTSDYLDKHVSPERSAFDLSYEKSSFEYEGDVSLIEIESGVIESVKEFLQEYLIANCERGKQRLNDFVSKKAPKYFPLLKKLDMNGDSIDPDISDKELDIKLHSAQAKIEEDILREGHILVDKLVLEKDFTTYKQQLNDYMISVNGLKQSALAEYVSHRRVVLDLLNKAMTLQPDEKYVKEDVIHNLIIPMRKTQNEISSNDNNLWLINERLVFHNFLASDKKLEEMPIMDSDSKDRPDVVMLQVYDNPLLFSESKIGPLASISIIEFKRPMRDDMTADYNPIDQVLNYVDKIRTGNCKTAQGRPIPNSQDIPAFCYIIADLTESLKKVCIRNDFTITADKMGYFGYKKNLKAYVEVISFEQLYNSALERNKAFFDKLGLPNI